MKGILAVPDTKQENADPRLDTAIAVGKVILPCILALVAWLSVEEGLYLFFSACTVLSVLGLLTLHFFPKLLSRTSPILDATGEPLSKSILGNRTIKVLYLIAVLCTVAALMWYRYGHEIVPSASITRFERSDIRYSYGEKPTSRKVPVNSFFLPAGEGLEDEILATSYAILTITRNGEFRTKSVRIESIDFKVTHVPFTEWKRRLGVAPRNVVLPVRYLASVSPNSNRVNAHMLDEKGDPTEGTVVLDNENKFAEIHITFKAAAGAGYYELYEVRPIVTTVDEMGKNRTELPHGEPLHISVWNNDANDPDALNKLMQGRR